MANNDIIISKHARMRLIERRKVKHMVRHINKIKSWNPPENGCLEHKGWRYIFRDNVLVTVLPKTNEYRKQMRRQGVHE